MPNSLVKILHTSDVHIDNCRAGADEDPARQGLIEVINRAAEEAVDLMLIAGDLFDHNRVKDEGIQFAIEQLSRIHCPVVLITGNHDCYAEYSIYHRMDVTSAGPHVHFLNQVQGEILELHDLGVRVWGRGIVDHHPGNRPLEKVPVRQGDYWYVGVTHGYFIDRGGQAYSSLITAEEIEETGFDYLALGHVHRYSEISQGRTCAAYSGSPNVDQHLGGASAAIVTMDPLSGVSVEETRLGRRMKFAAG